MRKQESQESQGAAMEVDREGPEPMDLSYIQKSVRGSRMDSNKIEGGDEG